MLSVHLRKKDSPMRLRKKRAQSNVIMCKKQKRKTCPAIHILRFNFPNKIEQPLQSQLAVSSASSTSSSAMAVLFSAFCGFYKSCHWAFSPIPRRLLKILPLFWLDLFQLRAQTDLERQSWAAAPKAEGKKKTISDSMTLAGWDGRSWGAEQLLWTRGENWWKYRRFVLKATGDFIYFYLGKTLNFKPKTQHERRWLIHFPQTTECDP